MTTDEGKGTLGGAREHPDLSQGPIASTLLIFALPTLGSNILQSLRASINTIWLGQLVGDAAIAATASANIIMFLLFSCFYGFGVAATVVVGQAFGARDFRLGREAFAGSLGFSLVTCIAAALFGFFASPAILRAMETPGEAYELALVFLRGQFVGMPASLIAVLFWMGLRGAGDSVTPLRFIILSVVLDCGLNPLFIAGFGPIPAMGMEGSAIATAIANYVIVIWLIYHIYRVDMPLRLKGAEFRWLIPSLAQMRMLITKGVPMGLQMLVGTAAGLIVVGLVNREGMMTTAAFSATQQLWTYLQMPAMAISAAASAMAAQSIGAGRWDRVGGITRYGLVFNLILTMLILTPMIIFDREILALFLGAGSPAIEIGRHIQLLGSWAFVLMGMTLVIFGTMRANGVVMAPLIIMAVSFYPARLGFYYLTYDWLGADAIWLAFPVGSGMSVILAAALYLHGGWKKETLIEPPEEEELIDQVNAEAEPAGRLTPTV